MIQNDDLRVVATGVGQIAFYHELDPETPLLSIGFCRDGFWTLPSSLVSECAALARAANCRLGVYGPSPADERPASISIVYQTGEHIDDYRLTAVGNAPEAQSRFICIVGNITTADLHGLSGFFLAADWNAALAPMRLFVQAPGLIGIDMADPIRAMSHRVTRCETWRLGEAPSAHAAESEHVWLGFSNRLLLTEVDEAARTVAAALPDRVTLGFHAGLDTTSTLQVDAMLSAPIHAGHKYREDAE